MTSKHYYPLPLQDGASSGHGPGPIQFSFPLDAQHAWGVPCGMSELLTLLSLDDQALKDSPFPTGAQIDI